MKTESKAWEALQKHAAAQLRRGFADRVLRATQGPEDAVWSRFFAAGARRLSPGFADRVLRAARLATELPSLRGHMALSAATAAVCLGAVVFLHDQSVERADARNLAEWERLVEMTGFDATNV